MIVQLIPFFLAANMSSEEVSSWSKGPELEFDATGRLKLSSFVPELRSVSVNVTFKLTCRQKGSDSLTCKTSDESTVVRTMNSEESGKTRHHDDNFIEMKFNEKGVESVTVDGDVYCEKTEMFKRISGMLSIGSNLKEEDRVFETQEDTTMGRCNTSIYQTKMTPQEPDENHPPNLHLIVTPLEMPEDKTKIEISKVRDPDTCNGTTRFFSYVERADTVSEVTYAINNMMITSPGTFQTYSDYRGDIMTVFRNDTIGLVEEFFTLKLVSVKKAMEHPFKVRNPSVQSPMLLPACSPDVD